LSGRAFLFEKRPIGESMIKVVGSLTLVGNFDTIIIVFRDSSMVEHAAVGTVWVVILGDTPRGGKILSRLFRSEEDLSV
jgi:hypothetical protein